MAMHDTNFSPEQAFRLRHYQGQRVIARDLQDEYDNLAWLRRLHVVGLHDTWGIAFGLEATVAKGMALVQPGFAYDCFGRELFLSQPVQIPLPEDVFRFATGFHTVPLFRQPEESFFGIAQKHYVLVMRYDSSIGQQPRVDDLCPQQGERPLFAWVTAEALQLGRDVPLLGVDLVRVLTRDIIGQVDQRVRRYTRPLARPHIGNGITPPAQIWTLWMLSLDRVLFLQTTVDTSEAGFVGTPDYFATLTYSVAVTGQSEQAGSPPATDMPQPGAVVASSLAVYSRIPYIFSGVAYPPDMGASGISPTQILPDTLPDSAPDSTSFIYRLTIDASDANNVNPLIAFLIAFLEHSEFPIRNIPLPFLRVAWMGVEAMSRCNQTQAAFAIQNEEIPL